MKQLPTLIILLISINLFSQEVEFDKYLMVKANKLSIRLEPSLESQRLGLVEKGELVKIVDRRFEDKNLVTIDGISNSWAKIEYKGIKGFMFGGYLANENEYVLIPNENWKGKYLLLMEGNQRNLVYSSELNWYGIYPKKDGEYIEKVEINLDYSLGEMDDNIKVSTNKKEKARIIIGTNERIENDRVGIPLGWFVNEGFLSWKTLPIPVYQDDCSIYSEYFLKANNWKSGEDCYIKDYSLSFCQYETSKINIKKLYTFEGLIEKLRDCNIPKLFWFGDVNGDEIPDFIFYNQAMYYSKYKLFLSNKKGAKINFKKVVDFIPSFTPC